MEALTADGSYTITDEMKERLTEFAGGYATEAETSECIRNVYEETGYVIDTHTAVAADVCCKYRKANRCDQDSEKNEEQSEKYLVASTASPYKFVKSVLTAIDEKYGETEELKLLEELEKVSGVEMPQAVREILDAKILHTLECDADKMKETVKGILKI